MERGFGAFLDHIVERGGEANELTGAGLIVFHDADPVRHVRPWSRQHSPSRRLQAIDTELGEPIGLHVGVNSGRVGRDGHPLDRDSRPLGDQRRGATGSAGFRRVPRHASGPGANPASRGVGPLVLRKRGNDRSFHRARVHYRLVLAFFARENGLIAPAGGMVKNMPAILARNWPDSPSGRRQWGPLSNHVE